MNLYFVYTKKYNLIGVIKAQTKESARDKSIKKWTRKRINPKLAILLDEGIIIKIPNMISKIPLIYTQNKGYPIIFGTIGSNQSGSKKCCIPMYINQLP